MKIAFVTRSTLYDVPGGDTVQVLQTARFLQELGIWVDICPTHEKIDYNIYDLFHYFNITRPADILFHTSQTQRPYVVSPVFVDYREYDRLHRKGISGFILRNLSSSRQEYAKTLGRWLLQKDTLRSKNYIWKGQRNSIRQVLGNAALVLPNSLAEYKKLEGDYGIKMDYTVIPNGIDTDLFYHDRKTVKDDKLVLCAARIEGIKNQLNLIRAMNNTRYTLLLVGSPAPNQQHYYAKCRKIAADNIIFHNHVPQAILAGFYRESKVHALPSWFETCGLSSMEAAAMGCAITITDKGFTREYFGNEAFYCEPGDPDSIYKAIDAAAKSAPPTQLRDKIYQQYTWRQAAARTLEAYQKIIPV